MWKVFRKKGNFDFSVKRNDSSEQAHMPLTIVKTHSKDKDLSCLKKNPKKHPERSPS